MRKPSEDMSRIDDRILEYGFEHSYMTTKTLHSVFDVTRTYLTSSRA